MDVLNMSLEEITYRDGGRSAFQTLNRPDKGNMFTGNRYLEIRDGINADRRETHKLGVAITGTGVWFLCIGGCGRLDPVRRCSADAAKIREHRSTENTGERVRQGFRCGQLRRLRMSCDITGDEAGKLAVASSEERAPDLTQLGR